MRAVPSAVTRKFLSAPPSGAIGKRRRGHQTHLLGRRVCVPQRFTDVEDDGDGFCFGATIIGGDAKRVLILYDYTGEQESWPSALASRWLEPDTDPIVIALEKASLSALKIRESGIRT